MRNICYSSDQKQVYFNQKAIFSLENYLVGRYHMHTQVYQHPVSIGYSLLFRAIMLRLHDLLKQNYRFQTTQLGLLFQVFHKQAHYQQ